MLKILEVWWFSRGHLRCEPSDGDVAKSLGFFLLDSKLKTLDTSDHIFKTDTLKSVYSDVTRINVTRF